MIITALSSEERIATGFAFKAVITHEDLTDTDTTQDITLATLTAGQFITKVGHRLVTDFASANGTGLTLSIGNGSSATGYAAAKELQATEIDYWQASPATPPTGAPDQVGETESLLARFVTSGGTSPTLAEYTAGEVNVYFSFGDLTKI
jgi:hypothetical protein